ncbi:MAG: HDIG domain-containing metalloprotein, partial [Halobacteriota archaeon]
MPSNNFPSYQRALQLLKDSGCSDRLIRHVKAVSQYAVEVAKLRGDADVALVRIGGLLHDIGRCKTNSIKHGVAGGKLLR